MALQSAINRPVEEAAPEHLIFRDPAAGRAAGYVLSIASLLVTFGLLFHPMPSRGFEERPSVLADTPWWGAIHVSIAAGFVLCALGSLLMLVAGGPGKTRWTRALFWSSMCMGMIYFTGVALINGWVMHKLVPFAAQERALYDAMNHLLIGFGWLGNPLFLFGLTGLAIERITLARSGSAPLARAGRCSWSRFCPGAEALDRQPDSTSSRY